MQVRVNGQVVTEPGTQVDLRRDKVRQQEAGRLTARAELCLLCYGAGFSGCVPGLRGS